MSPKKFLSSSILGRHHHEIQFDKQSNHWHIPIIDRNDTWLCLNLGGIPEDIGRELQAAEGLDINEYEWNDEELHPEVKRGNPGVAPEEEQSLYEWNEEDTIGENK